jgi:hypothetical protein
VSCKVSIVAYRVPPAAALPNPPFTATGHDQ